MEFEAIASGHYLEALSVEGNRVLYSDVVAGGIHEVGSSGAGGEWLPETQWIAALLCNSDGSIVYSGPHGIAWLNPGTGASGVLIDSIDDQPIPGVNEMTPDRKGGLYFGTIDLQAIIRGENPKPSALYHLSVDRQLTQLCDGLAFANGLSLSLDGRQLYHNESFVGTFAYDIIEDGALGERVMLAEKADCDGMALDGEGNIWISGFDSDFILCLQPDGQIRDRIKLPSYGATNVRFGGDGKDFYVTTIPAGVAGDIAKGKLPEAPASVIYRGRINVAGLPIVATEFCLA